MEFECKKTQNYNIVMLEQQHHRNPHFLHIELVSHGCHVTPRQQTQFDEISSYFRRDPTRITTQLLPFINNALGDILNENSPHPVGNSHIEQPDEHLVGDSQREQSGEHLADYECPPSSRPTKGNKVSGRLLDYLMTSYSKKNFCVYASDGRDVRTKYEAALNSAGGRCNFDPFNRKAYGLQVELRYTAEGSTAEHQIMSTVAQLNFVRWYFISGVYRYVAKNHRAIATDMTYTYRRINEEKRQLVFAGVKRKRQPLVGSDDVYSVLLYEGPTTVELLN